MTNETGSVAVRAFVDALTGCAVFWAFLAVSGGFWPIGTESVAAVLADTGGGTPGTAAAKVGGASAVIILAVVFTAMWAVNAAFVRHLRRVYASPRRDRRRRG